jgi:uncharacterized DUF497 family protein
MKLLKKWVCPSKGVFANLTFEWDEEKSENNFRKHKVSFEEAKSVFNDPFALTIPDRLFFKRTNISGSLFREAIKYTHYQLPEGK